MQTTIDFNKEPKAGADLIPSWGGKASLYSKEYSEKYIQGVGAQIEFFSRNNFSNHMVSYWTDGINFYKDWLTVLGGSFEIKEFEQKWLPKINHQKSNKL